MIWVNSWFDPGKERQAALTLIAQGADVRMQNTDSPAVLQAAQDKGKLSMNSYVEAVQGNVPNGKQAPKPARGRPARFLGRHCGIFTINGFRPAPTTYPQAHPRQMWIAATQYTKPGESFPQDFPLRIPGRAAGFSGAPPSRACRPMSACGALPAPRSLGKQRGVKPVLSPRPKPSPATIGPAYHTAPLAPPRAIHGFGNRLSTLKPSPVPGSLPPKPRRPADSPQLHNF